MSAKEQTSASIFEGGQSLPSPVGSGEDEGVSGEDLAGGDGGSLGDGEATEAPEEEDAAEEADDEAGRLDDDEGVNDDGNDQLTGDYRQIEEGRRAGHLTVGQVIAAACKDPTSGVYIAGINQIVDYARQNDKRPAYVVFSIPDDFAMNLGGHAQLMDWPFLVRLPRQFVEQMMKDAFGTN